MPFDLAYPSSILAPYVKSYWGLNAYHPHDQCDVQRIVPDGLISLYFYLGAQPEVVSGKPALEYPVFISGQVNHPYDIKVTGEVQIIAVTFQPLGASYLFGKSVHELLNNYVTVKDWSGVSTVQLEEALLKAKTFAQKVSLIEAFLLERLQKALKVINFNRIETSVQFIKQIGGQVALPDLADKACLSSKQFQRLFTELIGITPKGYLRIIRFQQALFLKQHHPEMDLMTLAYQCNYYDQAHMINDFKKLTGLTPRKYFLLCDPFSDYFST